MLGSQEALAGETFLLCVIITKLSSRSLCKAAVLQVQYLSCMIGAGLLKLRKSRLRNALLGDELSLGPELSGPEDLACDPIGIAW